MIVTQDANKILRRIDERLARIEEHLLDSELSAEEEEALKLYQDEKSVGKLIPHEQILKELELENA